MVLSSVPEMTGPCDVLQYPREGVVSVEASPGTIASFSGDLLVIGLWMNESEGTMNGDQASTKKDKTYILSETMKQYDSTLSGLISEMISDCDFTGKAGSSTEVCRLPAGSTIKRVVMYGLGMKSTKSVNLSMSNIGKFSITKGSTIKSCNNVGIYIDEQETMDVRSITEGAVTGAYVDERFKRAKENEYETMLYKKPKNLRIITESKVDEKSLNDGNAIGMGIITTKEVISAPANFLTPASLAIAAEKVAKETGLEIKILGRKECEKLNMGLYLGVGRGSTDEPKFIHMTYKSSETDENKKKVCIVGKAVTFDTGGTNLKTGAGSMIELMKFDMGGSAVCLGTAKAIGKIKPKNIEVHFIMPAVENMIGDRAIHPGDILTSSNGKTVEVINTDAEGRLCLADALIYAENLGDVDYIVDLATLTGAIIVSLGNDVAGFWSSSDQLADLIKNSADTVGEKIWQMPLVDEYAEGLKSKIADLRNIGQGRAAGSITAALFLREFVKTKNWAHIDIAGTVWSDKKDGATGYGVKTMIQWVESLST